MLTIAKINAMTQDELQKLMVCAAITSEAEWNAFLKAVAAGKIVEVKL